MKFTRRKMYAALVRDYFWFYKESFPFMGHQSMVKTFFQAIPKSFGFIKWQHDYYKQFI